MAAVTINPTRLSQERIDDQSFGGNYLFNRGGFRENIGLTGAFDEFAQKIGVSHLRYPGGAIAEQLFDISNPQVFNENDPNSAVGFLKEASAIGARVTIVLPSARYIQAIMSSDLGARMLAEAEIKSFVVNVLKSGYGSFVEGFELGNEFYGSVLSNFQSANPSVSAASAYGTVANQMAIWVQDAINTAGMGNDPAIIVQAGQTAVQNSEIINSFSSQGFGAIDGVTVHNYRWQPWNSQDTTTEKFGFIDAWQSKVGARDLLRVVSEWNVGSPNGVQGLPAAAGLLDIFNLQERLGVDRAQVWPLLQNATNALGSSVSKASPNLAPNLTIEGEIFRQMSRVLTGLSPYELDSRKDIDSDGTVDALVHAYGNGVDKLVVFFSSLEGVATDFTLDLASFGSLATGYTHLWAQVTGVIAGSDPLNAASAPAVATLTAGQLEGLVAGDGQFYFTLQPYEIVSLEFTIGRGVTLYGHDQTAQSDTLVGSLYSDSLFGGLGNDILDGGNGNDCLDGGGGADKMIGGNGDDVYVVDNVGDVVLESASEGTDLVQSSVSYILLSNFENLTLNGGGKVNGTGNAADNRIIGNANNNGLIGLDGNDSIFGGDGNDVLNGGAGSDYLAGENGNDTYFVDMASDVIVEKIGGGIDTVVTSITLTSLVAEVENLTLSGKTSTSGTGNELSNIITGNAGANSLFGLEGDDRLYGGNGLDRLFGGDGDDYLDGGARADYMSGGRGNDIYVVDTISDVIIEAAGEGVDTVNSAVTLALGAELEHLTLVGTASINGIGNGASNLLIGNSAANTLTGLDGDDLLIGGGGADVLFGGNGADQFIFNSAGSGVVTIADFNQLDGGFAEQDILVFQGLLLGRFSYLGSADFTGGLDNSEARVLGNQVLVDTNGDGVSDVNIAMTGLSSATQLAYNDFVWS